jgi:hypothetical protein
MNIRTRLALLRYLRTHSDPEDKQCARENAESGFPLDFRLPYPYPRNEHEEGMNWVACNSVISGRADW